MTSSIAPNIPAAILFLPDDVGNLTKWQEKFCSSFLPGIIEDYIGYCEFLEHRSGNEVINVERDKGRTRHRNPAIRCGHGLHPSDIIAGGYCPVCEVEMCLRFLNKLAQAFQRCGGPWPQARVHKEYLLVRQCWHLVRWQLVQLVESLECAMQYEEAWEEQHPDDVGCMWMTNSSSKAIRSAQMRTEYPAILVALSSIPRPAIKQELSSLDAARSKVAKARAKKHVAFTSNTITLPTRSAHSFCRDPAKRIAYEPGRHAAPLGMEWIDTSRVYSSIADLLNLKVYATCVEAEFDALIANSSLRLSIRSQGILSLRPGIQRISRFVNQILQGSETARSDMLKSISVADALIVLIGVEDVVLDMHLSVEDDVEDEDGYGDEAVD